MTSPVKKMLFALLVVACIAAAALLFLPDGEKDVPVATGSGAVATDPAAAPEMGFEAKSQAPDAGEAAGEWRTYHGDNALRGVAAWSYPADEPAVLWTVLTGGPVRQPPVASGGAVFAVTARGVVIAVSLDGVELWRRDLNAVEPAGASRLGVRIEAPLTAVAGKVFAGTDMGEVFALRADTGDVIWRTDIEGPVRGAINYASDGSRVFVINQDVGALVCLNTETGAVVWKSTDVDRSDGSPAIAGNVAVFGSCAAAMHVVSLDTGEKVKDIRIENGGGQIAGGVALADGFAYAGVRDGRTMRTDINAGTLAWTTEISLDEVFSTPAVSGDRVLVTAYDGFVYALARESGAVEWKHDLEGMPASPMIAGDGVIISADDTLHLLRLEDGAPLWRKQFADLITSPALLPGMIVVGGEDGTLTALGVK